MVDNQEPRERELAGWIAPMFNLFTKLVTFVPETLFIGPRGRDQQRPPTPDETRRRARRVDTYVAVWFLIELAALALVTDLPDNFRVVRWLAVVLVGYRALEIPATAMRVTLFDRLWTRPDRHPVVATHERLVVLAVVNFVELILCFSAIYAVDRSLIDPDADWFDPIYLSGITQLTIGYGDIHPRSWLRFVSILQGLFGLFLLVLLFGRFVSLLKQERSLLADASAADQPRQGQQERGVPPSAEPPVSGAGAEI